ncbi:hypothetical protein NKDENANG_01883 [Candidatus Entotheonellaceae bacterium PAL068K]
MGTCTGFWATGMTRKIEVRGPRTTPVWVNKVRRKYLTPHAQTAFRPQPKKGPVRERGKSR